MNQNTIQGSWTELKGKIKTAFGKFSEDELESFKGNLEQISGKIQKVYGYAQERAEKEYNDFKANLDGETKKEKVTTTIETSRYTPLFLILLAGALTSATTARASEVSATESSGDRGYAGLLFGGNSTTNSSDPNQTTTTFGATLGAKMTPEFGIGLFGSYYTQRSSGSFMGLPTGASTSTAVITGQANFFAGGLHLGAEAGPAINSWSGNISTAHTGNSNTNMVYGPEAGYDYKFTKTMSLGAEAHYLFSSGDASVNNIQALAALKVWL